MTEAVSSILLFFCTTLIGKGSIKSLFDVNLDWPSTVPYSAWMGALFSAVWGKTRAEEEDGDEEEARNGSRNGLKFIAPAHPD